MKGEFIVKISKNRLIKLSKIKDSDIDYSDIPELDEDFWEKAKPKIPNNKKAVSIRLDNDLLEWFKKQGSGYQTLMNAILKSYMQTHKH